MKKIRCLLLLSSALLFDAIGHTQNPFLTFPEEYMEEWGSTSILPNYGNTNAKYSHAGLMDPFGEIMFFKIDNHLYNKDGAITSGFYNYYGFSTTVNGISETLVVPQPGTCDKFYIFQSGRYGGLFPDELPYYSIYHHFDGSYGGGLEADYYGTAFPIENNLIEEWYRGYDPHEINGVHFAATKERDDDKRRVFISNNAEVYRLELGCDGLDSTGWKYTYHPGDLNSVLRSGWRTEMELYEDETTGNVRLAIPYRHNTASGDIKIAIFDLDGSTWELIPGSRQTVELANSPLMEATFVHGIEFSPDGRNLYIMHEINNTYPSPLSVYNISSASFTNLPYPGLGAFMNSQIEISGFPGNYSLIMASDDYLGRLTNPNFPNVSNWDPNALPLTNYYKNLGGSISWDISAYKHIVPDQIDYEDYNDIFLRSCECCEKYNYAGANMDTSRTVEQTEVWTYGEGNNPWDALTGETVYIRDHIIVEPGANLTIKGMDFKFGPEASVVVRRGDGTRSGAKLTIMDNTVFSADFRCADRRYSCPDPNDGCRDKKLWQGVRVEGYDHLDQTGPGAQKQGVFLMSNNSMIEYARIGVGVGREGCNNCGGAIVRILDSKLKDNPVGLQFAPYQRYHQGAEAYNRAAVENTHFTWTSDLRSFDALPDRHVDVRKSSGLTLRGNKYENEDYAYYPKTDRGVGLYMSQSRVHSTFLCQSGSVIPCPDLLRSEFRNLKIGVLDYGGSVRNLQVHHNIFHNNVLGVNTYGVINPEILNSDFAVPNEGNSAGVYMVSSTGYSIENNSFVGLADTGIDWNFGIVVHASGAFDNEIYRNTFKDLGTGISSAQVNAVAPEYDFGLRWKCNLFEHNMAFADIRVSDGTVSDEQGTCLTGVTGPAGNRFSHYSLVNQAHYDIKVDPDADPLLEIDYRHHQTIGGNPEEILPLRYTNSAVVSGDPDKVQLDLCGITWNQGDACPVKNYGGPPTLGDEPDLPGEGLNSLVDYGEEAGALYAQIEIAEAQLDNGLTDALVGAVFDGAGVDEIAPMLEEAGTMVSSRVLDALLASPDEALRALAYAAAGEATNTFVTSSNYDQITLPSEEIENQWKTLRSLENELWPEITAVYQKDTSGVIGGSALLDMLNEYKPNAGQRFAAALASELGQPVPEWISADNRVSGLTSSAMLPAIGENGSLPDHNDAWFTTGRFNTFSKARSLSGLYTSHDASFLPRFPAPQPAFGGDESKSGDKGRKGTKEEIAESGNFITMMPNPFGDRLTVRAEFAQPLETKATVRFHDALGREVMVSEIPAKTGDHQLDTQSLPAGLILYTVEVNGEVIQTGKVVKTE